jgi:predicted alpha/beta superfamily hydrolase
MALFKRNLQKAHGIRDLLTKAKQRVKMSGNNSGVALGQIDLASKESQKIIESNILDQSITIQIALPDSYDSEIFAPQEYTVIYLLDAEKHFDTVRAMLRSMASSNGGYPQIPETILIGINNPARNNARSDFTSLISRKKQVNLERLRNMTPTQSLLGWNGKILNKFSVSGGAGLFRRFIKEELIPNIELSYRCTRHRVVLGHSFSALFALDCAIEDSRLFNSLIALDPSIWWDDYRIAKQISSGIEVKGEWYLAGANNPQLTGFDQQMDAFAEKVSCLNAGRMQLTYQRFSDEEHGTLPLIGTYRGLLSVFSGYKVPHSIAELPDAGWLVSHFVQFNQKHSVSILPQEEIVNTLGLKWVDKDSDKAIELFKLNVTNHPDSSDSHYSLGFVYEKLNKRELAAGCYKMALALNHSNSEIAERLASLR